MCFFKKIVLISLFISLAACASKKAPPLPVQTDSFPSRGKPKTAPMAAPTGGEQALKSVIDAYKAGRNDVALASARTLQEQYPGTRWYKRSLFVVEQVLIQTDLPSQADAAMLRVKSEYPEMADYAVLMLADYNYSKNRFSEAAALYEDVTEQYPKSSLAMRAAFRRAQALLACNAYGAAADALRNFLRDYPRSDFSSDAALDLGKALAGDSQVDEAVQAYRDVWMKFPGTQADQDAAKALADLSASGVSVAPWGSDEWYERGKNLFRTSQYDKAADAFGQLLKKDNDSPNRAETLFRIGVSQYNTGRRAEAAAALEKMVKDYPHDSRVPEALYWIGKSYCRIGEREKGIQTLQKILHSYTESEWSDDALFQIGNTYREADDMRNALPFYRRLTTEYPDSRFADSAVWWNAWGYYRAGDYRKAEQTLEELITRYPRSFLAIQARYWEGRIEEREGNSSKAAEYYGKLLKRAPYTYYGYRAAERMANRKLQEPLIGPDSDIVTCAEGTCAPEAVSSPAVDVGDDGPPVWTEETRKLLAAEPSFKKTLELMHLQMKKEAAAELWCLEQRLPRKRGALIGLSKAFFELGDYYRSLILVLRNYERYLDGQGAQVPPDLWLLAYPQGYWDSIVSYSRKYGQDPYFIAAIIREESQFHADALSPAGARGVMQVMPATGAWIAQAIRLRAFDASKLFDYDTAINLGTWYISHLMKKFRNDPLLVAAAYNAGPDAVSAWIGKNSLASERDEFVESIPFAETRGYVKKVLRNYAEYKRIYGKNSPSIIPVSDKQGAIGSLVADEAKGR